VAHTPRKTREHYSIQIGARGRLVLPARLRRRMKLRDGERMILTLEPDGSVRLRTVAQVVDSCAGMHKHLVPPGISIVDEFIREKRREARRENHR
jgi:AbrB family looped-hinge helix DNA binding protein